MWFKKESADNKMEYFSSDWLEAWADSIKNSDKYREAGKNWNAPLIIKIDPKPENFKNKESIGIYLKLSYGECKSLRYAVADDQDQTDIILSADKKTWIDLIEKSKDPTMAIMKGKVKIEKGSLITLSTQRKAASALLKTAPAIHEGIPIVNKKHTTAARTKDPPHQNFITTTRGLDFDSFPMKLYQKAKHFGVWNPSDIDLKKDIDQWQALSIEDKRIISHLAGLFMAGEEAVTRDLLPLIQVIANEGRIEEEIYLTSFLWEEAKHTEFFSRYVQTVMSDDPDFEKFHKPMYKTLFYHKLPAALHDLSTDDSPAAQLKAAGTYTLIVEGTLAETGYEAFSKMLTENDLLPGLQEGINKLKQDESRHIAYGLYLINRLLHDNPRLADDFEKLLEELLYDATNVIHEIFDQYEVVPFGLKLDWFLDHAISQFQNRIAKLNL